MMERTKNNLWVVMGLVLMVLGGSSAVLALFYEFKVKPEMARRQQATPSAEVVVPSAVKAVSVSEPVATPKAVGVSDVVAYASGVYGSEEAGRKEGTLWVDRADQRLVVNLGVLNGLKAGDHLTVLDREDTVGRVTVIDAFDVVSYVEVDPTVKSSMQKDYYLVRMN